MPGMKLILLLVPMVAVMTLACSAESGSGASDDRPASDGSADAPSLGSPQPVSTVGLGPSQGTTDLPASIIDPVVDEIARVAGATPAEVVVVSGDAVTFPDGGLGCPEPGMAYTQVQVDGYKIVAVANGTTYDYRGTGAGMFRRCT